MSAGKLTKTAVKRHTSEIRRTAAELQTRVDAWHSAIANGRTRPDVTLEDVFSEPAQRAYLAELLNVIDGTSAQLRELLTGDQL